MGGSGGLIVESRPMERLGRPITAALLPAASVGATGASSPATGSPPTSRLRPHAARPSTVGPAETISFPSDGVVVRPRAVGPADVATLGDLEPVRAAPLGGIDASRQRITPSLPRATAAPSAVTTPAVAALVVPRADPVPTHPVSTVISGVLSALGFSPSASSYRDAPVAPMPMLSGVLELMRREIEHLAFYPVPPPQPAAR